MVKGSKLTVNLKKLNRGERPFLVTSVSRQTVPANRHTGPVVDVSKSQLRSFRAWKRHTIVQK